MTIGNKRFDRGLGTHSNGHIRITSPVPNVSLAAWIGVDNNERTQATKGSVVFSVSADGRECFRSGTIRSSQEPLQIDVKFDEAKTLDLHVAIQETASGGITPIGPRQP